MPQSMNVSERTWSPGQILQREPIFEVDAVPFFPFRFTEEGGKWIVRNPLTGREQELNEAGYWVLRLCDGYRTWYEIVHELARAYRNSFVATRETAEPFVDSFTRQGMVWWRKRRMEWHPSPPPMAVLWDLTEKCNLHCRHCVVASDSGRTEQLSLAECVRLMDEMADFGVRQLILSGGEPLVRKDFFSIAEHAAQKGLALQVATNGTLVDKTRAQRLAAIGAHAQVSLDALRDSVHDDFRGCRGAWKKTVSGIKYLVQQKVYVSVAAVVTTVNIDEIPDLYRFIAGLGADCFRIMPFVPFGRGAKARALEVVPSQMRELTVRLEQLKREVGLPLVPMEFECTMQAPQKTIFPGREPRIGCDGSVAYCTVTAKGEVLPCNYFSGVETDNIRQKSFAWVWHNSRILNYFRSLRTSDIHGVCQRCEWLADCRGSCLAANFAHGEIFQSNCHCWRVHEHKACTSAS